MYSSTTDPSIVCAPEAFLATNSASSSEDDSKVDYTSMLGKEERRQRFIEELVDKDLKDIVRVGWLRLHLPLITLRTLGKGPSTRITCHARDGMLQVMLTVWCNVG